MKSMGVNEIREKFLSFFESKGCLRLGSFPLIPKNDASLLLINSGMAPMKPWFQNPETAPKRRVTTCQKCIRTGDIENVGKTARHGTFFEMLGNFSFGDYFKKEATAWAWEFFTKVMEIPQERLWISVYEEDDEARDIWVNEVGVDPAHIVKLGKEDNFWEHGTGPCGPCSEIYFDRGEEYGCGEPGCGVGCECDRFMEVWNLVFTQFDKDEDGNYNRLPNPNIDTGMGLERLAVVMQGVDNLFEIDTVQDVMKHICRIANIEYKKDDKKDVSLRVITDHIRSTVMMVSDGVIPSNEGRGYVLRRLLRRAARHGKLLGINKQFLFEVADTVIECSKGAYPELGKKELLAVPFPMSKDPEVLKSYHDAGAEKVKAVLDQGKDVVFLTLGDPTVYSTYLYIHHRLVAQGYETEIVCGITSFCAVSARLNTGLVEKAEPLHVIPASYQIEDALKLPGTKVLMKAGKKMRNVKEQLLAQGAEAMMIENCGMPDEKIYRSVEEIPEDAGYYSLIIIKENKERTQE